MISFTPIRLLFSIFGLEIQAWGLIFVIAFLTAFFLILKESKKQNIERKQIYNIALLTLLGAIIGPRLLFVFEHLGYFLSKPLEIISAWNGGITSYGAFLGLFFVWLYTNKQKIELKKILNLMAPYLALAIVIARIGCFIAWDDFGISSTLPWAVNGVHPTQLYESLYCLVIFFVLLKFKSSEKKKDSLFLFFIMFYSFFRFFNDFLRVYETYFLSLALSQWICLFIFIMSLVLLQKNYRKMKVQNNNNQTVSPQPMSLQ